MKKSTHLPAFIKYHREQLGLTQEQLALKAGVGLRFVRELEQGKSTLRLDIINKVLDLFGYEMRAARETIDAYRVWRDYFNKPVVITLKNKQKIYGFIIHEVKNEEHEIKAWRIVPNNNAIEWKETRDEKKKEKLERIINHSDIVEIEYQKK